MCCTDARDGHATDATGCFGSSCSYDARFCDPCGGGTADPKTAKPDPKKKKNEATDTKDDPAAAHKQQIVDLLERSHAANDEVLPDQKATLLARQISMISRLNSDSAEKWAQELFQLGDDQADDQKRARMQVMAIQMVAQGDPEFGLKLLHQIKPVAETDSTALVSANMISVAASAVFQGLARDKGESQLPRLRQEALRLAAESQYPYSAMGSVAVELLRDQPARGRWFQRDARFVAGVSIRRGRRQLRTKRSDVVGEFGLWTNDAAACLPASKRKSTACAGSFREQRADHALGFRSLDESGFGRGSRRR